MIISVKKRGGEQMDARSFFDKQVRISEITDLGKVEQRNIKSSIGPFGFLPDYKIRYSKTVIQALGELYAEYNKAFISPIEKNIEWKTDYHYCLEGGVPTNFMVQVDMVGLPEGFLVAAKNMSVDKVREVLRKKIFEIENSIAMYQLLQQFFSIDGRDSYFKIQFRSTLDRIKKRFKKRIALLAITEEKYQAVKEIEFGVLNGGVLSNELVQELSGFDCFLGPEEFRRHIEKNKGVCKYLLYARSSNPVSKLRNPNLEVKHPLLSNPKMREIIKANALNLNIDDPEGDSARMINDTKEYQPRMGMALFIDSEADLYSLEFSAHLYAGKKYEDYSDKRLSPGFVSFLKKQGIDPKKVESGKVGLRAKPCKCAYGCYGHVAGALTDPKFRSKLRCNLRKRDGGYVIQAEMEMPKITNSTDGVEYSYIDRNFFAFTNGRPVFLGGVRSLMPVHSTEGKNGRNHGSPLTVSAEITA